MAYLRNVIFTSLLVMGMGVVCSRGTVECYSCSHVVADGNRTMNCIDDPASSTEGQNPTKCTDEKGCYTRVIWKNDDGSVVNVGRGCKTDVNPVGCFPDDNQLVCEYHCATNLCNNNNVTVMPDMMTTAANPAQPTAVGTASISKMTVLPLSLLLFVSRL